MTPTAPGRLWPAVLGGWLLVCVLVTVTCWGDIAGLRYRDPDDVLRLLEVRDLLGGQSWWDVNQHRLVSGLMHWSRLVDLPLASVELLVRLWFGQLAAERTASVVVPLLTLGAVMAFIAALTRRLLDAEHARISLLITPLSVAMMVQLRPMRIDHHGWQIACALAALLSFTSRRPDARSGAIGGAALAVLLTISLEGLPIAAALLGLVALGWALAPARRAQMVAATATMFGCAVLLHLATRGPHVFTPACDAVSPVWLAVLGVAAVSTALAALANPARLPVRIGLLALGAVASGAALLLVDPHCLAGPFGMLDPIVRKLWYNNVNEGLPIWRQDPAWAALCVGLPIVGLYGAIRATLAAEGERRIAWWLVLGAQVATLALSLQVSRVAGTANAFAVPGVATVLLALLERARRVPRVPGRIVATAGALVAASPGLAMLPVVRLTERLAGSTSGQTITVESAPCTGADDLRALAVLPPARLFAPIDIAAEIVAATDHHAITTGHHRNAAAMRDVMTAFIAAPDAARATVERYHADYVVGCAGFPETGLYKKVAPNGFWARLERGDRFAWLRPVKVPGSAMLVWRVVAAATPAPLSTSPLSTSPLSASPLSSGPARP